jgi:protoheme ferro-lyase
MLGASVICFELNAYVKSRIGVQGRFLHHCGDEFRYIPCLNERDDWIAALAQIAGKIT